MINYTYNDQWIPYAGSGKYLWFLLLIFLSLAFFYFSNRLKTPIKIRQIKGKGSLFLVITWFLVFTVLASLFFLYLSLFNPANGVIGVFWDLVVPVVPATASSVLVAFFAIYYLKRKNGFLVAFGSAIIGIVLAFVVFELPFTIIAAPRTSAPQPLYILRAVYLCFFWLFMVLTLFLPAILPSIKVTKYTLQAISIMFFAFALWAFGGFSFPSTLASIALNGLAKMMAFIAVVTLFLPARKNIFR